MTKSDRDDKRNQLASRVSTPPVIKEDVIASFGYPAIRIPPQEAGITLNLRSNRD
jgi:hypothetical protein